MADDFPDEITQKIGVLLRRETEARVLAPVIEALAEAFGRAQVLAVVKQAIVDLARTQGAALAAEHGTGARDFFDTLGFWMKDGALEIDVLKQDDTHLDFNVTRCRYAEMYRALGIEELGAVFSCNRDFALIEGFNRDAHLSREKTILGGADCCTFRYDFANRDKN